MTTARNRLDELFLSATMTGTNATNATDAEAPPLTTATLMEAVRRLQASLPVVFYEVSEHVEPGFVYKLPNEQARVGYDLICHTDTEAAMLANAPRNIVLRRLNSAERERRCKVLIEQMWA